MKFISSFIKECCYLTLIFSFWLIIILTPFCIKFTLPVLDKLIDDYLKEITRGI